MKTHAIEERGERLENGSSRNRQRYYLKSKEKKMQAEREMRIAQGLPPSPTIVCALFSSSYLSIAYINIIFTGRFYDKC